MNLTTLTTNTVARRRAVFLRTSALALILATLPLTFSAEQAMAGPAEDQYKTTNGGLTELKFEFGPVENSVVAAVSGDGTTAVGYFFINNVENAGAWGPTGSRRLDGNETSSAAFGVNKDGTVIVGNVGTQAAVWTNGELSLLPGSAAKAFDVSNDGSVIVGGTSIVADQGGTAVMWKTGGALPITLSEVGHNRAVGVSGDGTVATGFTDSFAAYRWDIGNNDEVVETKLADLSERAMSRTAGISDDGSVIIGNSLSSDNNIKAVMWKGSEPVYQLDQDNAWQTTYANAVNGDGTVIVGGVASATEVHAYRWTEADGIITVEQWLRNSGFNITTDKTSQAMGVSDDGDVVVGINTDKTSFIARRWSGIIDPEEYQTTLANNPNTQVGLGYASTIMNGAHGQPMRNLLGVGQQSFSITNDTGYDDNGYSNGGLTIGDLTYARGFEGGITGRIALGGVYTDQDIATGGSFDVKGFYIAPEASIALGDSGVYATVGGYYSHGRMTIDRGYLNGGVMDFSSGKTDTETFGAKLRFDWLNAANYAGTDFTPYASLSYAHSEMDAYSETGGGFPSSFDAVKDHSTVARIGLDMVHGLSDTVRLLGKAEAAYRFEDQTAGTSGSINGLSSFAFNGQDVDQFWVRAGAGAEFDIGGGTASMTVNATTDGDDPNVWLRSSWTVKF